MQHLLKVFKFLQVCLASQLVAMDKVEGPATLIVFLGLVLTTDQTTVGHTGGYSEGAGGMAAKLSFAAKAVPADLLPAL